MSAEVREDTKTRTILTPGEGHAHFEVAIPRILGMSAEEFLRRYDAGEYSDLPDTPEYWNIERAIFLIPLARPDS